MLELLADRPALCHDEPCDLNLLIKITPPRRARNQKRPPINLALVLDRSGSMQGEKIELTRRAAAGAVERLGSRDRLSITTFANEALIVIAQTPVKDRPALLQKIQQIRASGATALFAGWQSGAAQASQELKPKQLNRLLLLTDGQANVGETDPKLICPELERLCQAGLTTTTLGCGPDYNEELLRAMASSGGGNHAFVERPEQIQQLVEFEIEGLAATVGTKVQLSLESSWEIQPLGEQRPLASGAYPLADLIIGQPLTLLFRVRVPASTSEDPGLTAQLEWHSPLSGTVQSHRMPLLLPRVSTSHRLQLPENPEVAAQVAAVAALTCQRQAVAALKGGLYQQAEEIVAQAVGSQGFSEESRSQLQHLQRSLQARDESTCSKWVESQSHSLSRGSQVIGAVEEQLLQGWLDSQQIAVKPGAFLRQPPSGHPPLDRVEGMLRGLWRGSQDQEPAQLSLLTLRSLTGSNRLMPWISGFFRALTNADLPQPSPAFQEFQQRVQAGHSFLEAGSLAPDCGALARLAPLLLARYRGPNPSHWSFILLGCHLTHRHPQASAASLGLAHLLWQLMLSPQFKKEPLLDWFLGPLQQVESSPGLSQQISQRLALAQQQGWSFTQARQAWGAGQQLDQVLPAFLYLLQQHGHEPDLALEQVRDSPWLGALVGAALGAQHGSWDDWSWSTSAQEAYQDFVDHL